MSIDNALQSAIYDALAATGYDVYDHVPQGAAYPYITIDYTLAVDAGLIRTRMEDHRVYLTFWSEYAGQKEIKTMQDAAWSALHEQRLTLSTGAICSLRVASRDTRRDADELTYMGSMTLSILVTA